MPPQGERAQIEDSQEDVQPTEESVGILDVNQIVAGAMYGSPEAHNDDLPIGNQEDEGGSLEVGDLYQQSIQEIEAAQYTDSDNPQTKGSFESLKSKQKRRIQEFKAAMEEKETQLQEAQKQLESLKEKASSVEGLQEKLSELDKLKKGREEDKKEMERLRYAALLYDADNDPDVKRHWVEPMEKLEKTSKDIIDFSLDEENNLWGDLLSAGDSVPLINEIIDSSGIRGSNAIDLKNSFLQYQKLKKDYESSFSKENIKASLERTRGKSVRLSDEQAQSAMQDIGVKFDEYINTKLLSKSETNKDQNFYVANKIDEDAVKFFNEARSSIPAANQSPGVLASQALNARSRAALPRVVHMAEYYMELAEKLSKENEKLKAKPKITQTKEKAINTLDLENGEGVQSIDEIIAKSFM